MIRWSAAIWLAVLVAGCVPERARYNTVILEHAARQQLYTREYGPLRAILPGCTVDAGGLNVSFTGLSSDEAQIGYESTDVPKDARRRCRRDRNIEHHAWLSFDLSDYTRNRGGGPLTQATFSGVSANDARNVNCDVTRRPFLKAINLSPTQLSLDVPSDGRHFAREAPGIRLGGRDVPFRERQTSLGEGDTGPRRGSAPNFVYALSAREVARLRDRLAAEEETFVFEFDMTLVGPANPDITGDRFCLQRLKDLRLTLAFRREA